MLTLRPHLSIYYRQCPKQSPLTDSNVARPAPSAGCWLCSNTAALATSCRSSLTGGSSECPRASRGRRGQRSWTPLFPCSSRRCSWCTAGTGRWAAAARSPTGGVRLGGRGGRQKQVCVVECLSFDHQYFPVNCIISAWKQKALIHRYL